MYFLPKLSIWVCDVDVIVIRHQHGGVDLDAVLVGGVGEAVADEIDEFVGVVAGSEEQAALEAAFGDLVAAARVEWPGTDTFVAASLTACAVVGTAVGACSELGGSSHTWVSARGELRCSAGVDFLGSASDL